MSTILVELYDALKEAGSSEEKARRRRKSGRQDQLDRTRDEIARLDKELAVINAQIDPLGWMSGIVIAGVLTLIIKTFFA